MHGSNSIKILRSDNGSEYMSKSFQLMCRDNGIKQQFTAPYSSFQNGVAELKNRTIIEGTRALLLDAQADQSLWIYAALFENKMLNCVFDSKRQAIPYEVFHGHLSIKYLNTVEIWGSPVWVHVHQKHRNKLEPTAKAAIYLFQKSNNCFSQQQSDL
jgi:transposase InsO family protein